MAEQMFLIDSNSFITPYRQYYSFDFARSFWDNWSITLTVGKYAILDIVFDEILKGNDELKDWGAGLKPEHFIDHREAQILSYYGEIMQYLQTSPYYKETALAEWAKATVAILG